MLPEFTYIEEAENFLAELTRRVGCGELDFQAGLDLSAMTKNWIDAKYAREELQLKLTAQGGGSEQHITSTFIQGTSTTTPSLRSRTASAGCCNDSR